MTIEEIAEQLRTQDNRATHLPIFVVEQKRRINGIDLDLTDDYDWYDCENDCQIASKEQRAELDRKENEDEEIESGWAKFGYQDVWEFVTACFTEQGCKDYLDANGHNLKEPRIYVHSAHRNREWQTVREFLVSQNKTENKP